MGLIDKHLFEKKRGFCGGDSDYHLHRMSCCGSSCVEDDEVSDLYVDASDLSKHVSLLRESAEAASSIPCPFCGATDWELHEVLEVIDLPPEWSWACYPR